MSRSQYVALWIGAAMGAVGLAAIAWWLPIVVFIVPAVLYALVERLSDWRIDRTVREIERNQRVKS